jgi:hypothetical protein
MSKIIQPNSFKRPLNDDQIEVVDLLKEALAQALEGNVSSVAVIACMKTGYATVMAGRQAADLNLGCDSLKRKILDAVEFAGAQLQRDVS